MKLLAATAALLALAAGGAAFPGQAIAGATCSVIEQANVCLDPENGTFDISSIHPSNPIRIAGRCGGKVVWSGKANFPMVNEMYKIICQSDDLQVDY